SRSATFGRCLLTSRKTSPSRSALATTRKSCTDPSSVTRLSRYTENSLAIRIDNIDLRSCDLKDGRHIGQNTKNLQNRGKYREINQGRKKSGLFLRRFLAADCAANLLGCGYAGLFISENESKFRRNLQTFEAFREWEAPSGCD